MKTLEKMEPLPTKEFQQWFSEAVDILEIVFGIRNLSVCELFHIGKIIRELHLSY